MKPMSPILEVLNPVSLYKIKVNDFIVLESLDSWLPPELQSEDDSATHNESAYQLIQCSQRTTIAYLALMSVIMEHPTNKSDRFIHKGHFRAFEELAIVTISGKSKKVDDMDTLQHLVKTCYRKITTLFSYRFKLLEDNFAMFWFFRSVFTGASKLLQRYARDELSGPIHTKALLTVILKQKDITSLKNAIDWV